MSHKKIGVIAALEDLLRIKRELISGNAVQEVQETVSFLDGIMSF